MFVRFSFVICVSLVMSTLPASPVIARPSASRRNLALSSPVGASTHAIRALMDQIVSPLSMWTQTTNLKVNPVDGAVMVYIPAGEFTMGSSDDRSKDYFAKFQDCEKPAHQVFLDGYYIYKNLVTVAMYRKYCEETGASMPSSPPWGWDKDDYPIVNVTWYDAQAYAQWAGASLPTEAQWEKAARGTDGRIYPWGNDWNDARCANSVNVRRTTPKSVGSYPDGASPYGVLDMAGNVFQWCSDWFDVTYYSHSLPTDPTGPSDGKTRVLRGGPWNGNIPDFFRATFRGGYSPANSGVFYGFRCVIPADR
ncbi:MAG: formylglycine-generating enzyme family protein [Capsulimonadaceae bacterium]